MTTLTATYAARAAEAADSTWLKIEQEKFSPLVQQAGKADIAAMWAFAVSGKSAREYRSDNCPVRLEDGVVTVPLDFYVFPCDLGLPYRLSAAIGSISGPVYVEREREFDLVFRHAASVDLGYLAAGFTAEPLTEAFNEYGEPVSTPSISYRDGKALLSRSCWRAYRVRCRALGYRHTSIMHLVKAEEIETPEGDIDWSGYRIENLENTIQAAWLEGGKVRTAEKELAYPPCVEDFLAFCPDGGLSTGINLNPREPYFRVWYSTCTGNTLRVRRVSP